MRGGGGASRGRGAVGCGQASRMVGQESRRWRWVGLEVAAPRVPSIHYITSTQEVRRPKHWRSAPRPHPPPTPSFPPPPPHPRKRTWYSRMHAWMDTGCTVSGSGSSNLGAAAARARIMDSTLGWGWGWGRVGVGAGLGLGQGWGWVGGLGGCSRSKKRW